MEDNNNFPAKLYGLPNSDFENGSLLFELAPLKNYCRYHKIKVNPDDGSTPIWSLVDSISEQFAVYDSEYGKSLVKKIGNNYKLISFVKERSDYE